MDAQEDSKSAVESPDYGVGEKLKEWLAIPTLSPGRTPIDPPGSPLAEVKINTSDNEDDVTSELADDVTTELEDDVYDLAHDILGNHADEWIIERAADVLQTLVGGGPLSYKSRPKYHETNCPPHRKVGNRKRTLPKQATTSRAKDATKPKEKRNVLSTNTVAAIRESSEREKERASTRSKLENKQREAYRELERFLSQLEKKGKVRKGAKLGSMSSSEETGFFEGIMSVLSTQSPIAACSDLASPPSTRVQRAALQALLADSDDSIQSHGSTTPSLYRKPIPLSASVPVNRDQGPLGFPFVNRLAELPRAAAACHTSTALSDYYTSESTISPRFGLSSPKKQPTSMEESFLAKEAKNSGSASGSSKPRPSSKPKRDSKDLRRRPSVLSSESEHSFSTSLPTPHSLKVISEKPGSEDNNFPDEIGKPTSNSFPLPVGNFIPTARDSSKPHTHKLIPKHRVQGSFLPRTPRTGSNKQPINSTFHRKDSPNDDDTEIVDLNLPPMSTPVPSDPQRSPFGKPRRCPSKGSSPLIHTEHVPVVVRATSAMLELSSEEGGTAKRISLLDSLQRDGTHLERVKPIKVFRSQARFSSPSTQAREGRFHKMRTSKRRSVSLQTGIPCPIEAVRDMSGAFHDNMSNQIFSKVLSPSKGSQDIEIVTSTSFKESSMYEDVHDTASNHESNVSDLDHEQTYTSLTLPQLPDTLWDPVPDEVMLHGREYRPIDASPPLPERNFDILQKKGLPDLSSEDASDPFSQIPSIRDTVETLRSSSVEEEREHNDKAEATSKGENDSEESVDRVSLLRRAASGDMSGERYPSRLRALPEAKDLNKNDGRQSGKLEDGVDEVEAFRETRDCRIARPCPLQELGTSEQKSRDFGQPSEFGASSRLQVGVHQSFSNSDPKREGWKVPLKIDTSAKIVPIVVQGKSMDYWYPPRNQAVEEKGSLKTEVEEKVVTHEMDAHVQPETPTKTVVVPGSDVAGDIKLSSKSSPLVRTVKQPRSVSDCNTSSSTKSSTSLVLEVTMDQSEVEVQLRIDSSEEFPEPGVFTFSQTDSDSAISSREAAQIKQASDGGDRAHHGIEEGSDLVNSSWMSPSREVLIRVSPLDDDSVYTKRSADQAGSGDQFKESKEAFGLLADTCKNENAGCTDEVRASDLDDSPQLYLNSSSSSGCQDRWINKDVRPAQDLTSDRTGGVGMTLLDPIIGRCDLAFREGKVNQSKKASSATSDCVHALDEVDWLSTDETSELAKSKNTVSGTMPNRIIRGPEVIDLTLIEEDISMDQPCKVKDTNELDEGGHEIYCVTADDTNKVGSPCASRVEGSEEMGKSEGDWLESLASLFVHGDTGLPTRRSHDLDLMRSMMIQHIRRSILSGEEDSLNGTVFFRPTINIIQGPREKDETNGIGNVINVEDVVHGTRGHRDFVIDCEDDLQGGKEARESAVSCNEADVYGDTVKESSFEDSLIEVLDVEMLKQRYDILETIEEGSEGASNCSIESVANCDGIEDRKNDILAQEIGEISPGLANKFKETEIILDGLLAEASRHGTEQKIEAGQDIIHIRTGDSWHFRETSKTQGTSPELYCADDDGLGRELNSLDDSVEVLKAAMFDNRRPGRRLPMQPRPRDSLAIIDLSVYEDLNEQIIDVKELEQGVNLICCSPKGSSVRETEASINCSNREGFHKSEEARPMIEAGASCEAIETIFVEESFLSSDVFKYGEHEGYVFDWLRDESSDVNTRQPCQCNKRGTRITPASEGLSVSSLDIPGDGDNTGLDASAISANGSPVQSKGGRNFTPRSPALDPEEVIYLGTNHRFFQSRPEPVTWTDALGDSTLKPRSELMMPSLEHDKGSCTAEEIKAPRRLFGKNFSRKWARTLRRQGLFQQRSGFAANKQGLPTKQQLLTSSRLERARRLLARKSNDPHGPKTSGQHASNDILTVVPRKRQNRSRSSIQVQSDSILNSVSNSIEENFSNSPRTTSKESTSTITLPIALQSPTQYDSSSSPGSRSTLTVPLPLTFWADQGSGMYDVSQSPKEGGGDTDSCSTLTIPLPEDLTELLRPRSGSSSSLTLRLLAGDNSLTSLSNQEQNAPRSMRKNEGVRKSFRLGADASGDSVGNRGSIESDSVPESSSGFFSQKEDTNAWLYQEFPPKLFLNVRETTNPSHLHAKKAATSRNGNIGEDANQFMIRTPTLANCIPTTRIYTVAGSLEDGTDSSILAIDNEKKINGGLPRQAMPRASTSKKQPKNKSTISQPTNFEAQVERDQAVRMQIIRKPKGRKLTGSLPSQLKERFRFAYPGSLLGIAGRRNHADSASEATE